MSRISLGVVSILLGLSSTARADQCEWIDEAVAQKAAALVRESLAFVEWCQPCGDAKPSERIAVASVEVRPADDPQFRELWVNGKAVDLAYLFVPGEGDTFRNVSKVIGCPSTSVSTEIRIDTDGHAVPLASPIKTVVGTVRGFEEGEHARCIVRTEDDRLELVIGKDFRGRCRDALGDEVRASYTEELSPEEPTGDMLVLHKLQVLRRRLRD
jgi:hypothetical protein